MSDGQFTAKAAVLWGTIPKEARERTGMVKRRQLQRSSYGKGGPFRFVRQLLGGSCFFDATRFTQEQRTLHAHEDLRCRAGMFSHAFVFFHLRLT